MFLSTPEGTFHFPHTDFIYYLILQILFRIYSSILWGKYNMIFTYPFTIR
ncbi:hypothetical protein HMPREF3293_02714 [Christensenella minuta]|uniref:Uncharacterized protein n=1 Tax=Christensenella minuta TaxID=626937 RepID=A0A136Q1Z8_9FIRM|nr:hypothetical protein HMPREF3293_02714 [Christensenella minuta]